MAVAKALSIPCAFALVLAVAGAAEARPAGDAATLLRESIDAQRTVSYIGQIETIRFSSSHAIATIVKVEHQAPDSTRRWYVAPDALYGDYVITRGASTYQFDTKNDRVTVSHNPTLDNSIATTGNFGRVMANYRAVREDNEPVANRETVSIVLINRYTGERAMRVWLDRQTHLVLKKEDYHANGSVASQTRFDALRYTAEIPGDIFSTRTPTGYAEVQGAPVLMMDSDIDRVIAQAGFKPYEPQNLPRGFTLASGDVRDVSGVKTLHLLYTDGLRSISLFQNATGAAADFGTVKPKIVQFEGHDGEFVEDGPTALLAWKEHSLHFALVGDLLLSESLEIATSVVP